MKFQKEYSAIFADIFPCLPDFESQQNRVMFEMSIPLKPPKNYRKVGAFTKAGFNRLQIHLHKGD